MALPKSFHRDHLPRGPSRRGKEMRGSRYATKTTRGLGGIRGRRYDCRLRDRRERRDIARHGLSISLWNPTRQ